MPDHCRVCLSERGERERGREGGEGRREERGSSAGDGGEREVDRSSAGGVAVVARSPESVA